jgi:hypothetical protein
MVLAVLTVVGLWFQGSCGWLWPLLNLHILLRSFKELKHEARTVYGVLALIVSLIKLGS